MFSTFNSRKTLNAKEYDAQSFPCIQGFVGVMGSNYDRAKLFFKAEFSITKIRRTIPSLLLRHLTMYVIDLQECHLLGTIVQVERKGHQALVPNHLSSLLLDIYGCHLKLICRLKVPDDPLMQRSIATTEDVGQMCGVSNDKDEGAILCHRIWILPEFNNLSPKVSVLCTGSSKSDIKFVKKLYTRYWANEHRQVVDNNKYKKCTCKCT